jgi:exopolysaccharide biosynthesis polyprenyl glycosylphosphotransferase
VTIAADEGRVGESRSASVSLRPSRPEVATATRAVHRLAVAARLSREWRQTLLRRLLALGDAGAVLLASLSVALSSGTQTALWSAAFLPVWILAAKLHGLYHRDQRTLRHLTADELPAILTWSLVSTATVTILSQLIQAARLDLATALQLWLVAAAAAFVLRGVARAGWRRFTLPERAIIVGSGSLPEAVRRNLKLFPDIHLELVGDVGELPLEAVLADDRLLERFDRVILASQALDEEALARLLAGCRQHDVRLSVVPPARGMFGTAVQLTHVAELPLVEYSTWSAPRSTLLLKRTLDVAVASVALVLVAPLLALVAIAVRLDSRGPALFTQRRAGLDGRPFRMFKFRTMASDAEERLGEVVALEGLGEPMFKVRDDPRVTRLGGFLRRTSIDELPQLVNVLKGEMSLVGPRPEQLELVERYRPEHRFRLSAKPGLTGPMQVYGRGALTFEERLAVERDYIENLSLGRDLRILALTLPAVVRANGAY